jgi:superfamily I DNA/RNA helicase
MAEYYFNLPPITELTIPQQSALNETSPIALSGGPGTGKSVVSLWRHISNHKNNKNSMLLTYTTTLAMYLKKCCGENLNAVANVKTTFRGKPSMNSSYYEVIVDEAQDMPNSYYEDIKNIALISYGADDSQILYPDNCSKQKDLKIIFPSNIECVLDKNFRNTQRIMQFAKIAFEEAFIPASTITDLSKNIGELPIMLISGGSMYETSNEKQNQAILNIIKQFTSDPFHNIAILVPWKNEVKYFYQIVKESFPSCTRYYNDNIDFPEGCGLISNIHLTTFKSSKGLEFHTIIIPNFDKLMNDVPLVFNNIIKCNWNDIYVAVTRARNNLYLITNNDMPNLNDVVDKQDIVNNSNNSSISSSSSSIDINNLPF